MSMVTEKTIGIRELVRNTKAVSRATRRGVSFVVLRNTEPIFRIEPIDRTASGRTYALADLLSIRFRSRDTNLSKKVDEIAYGV